MGIRQSKITPAILLPESLGHIVGVLGHALSPADGLLFTSFLAQQFDLQEITHLKLGHVACDLGHAGLLIQRPGFNPRPGKPDTSLNSIGILRLKNG